MWRDERDIKLDSLPYFVVKQIEKGINPCNLTGLSFDILEHIRSYQLSKLNILTLAGLSEEEAREILHRRDRYVGRAKKRR